ncbi:MAG TPA: DUF805 domain-containing protein [Caulobacteraceae bacterium]|nr:DUF805 domain-containing protein [Caulobacteraceae bacterium]
MHTGAIDWRELFASAAGRVGRAPFWVATAILLAVAAAYEAVAGPTLRLLTFWFVYPLLIASAVCVVSKRLHDRGRSGWWAALVLFAVVMNWPAPHGVRALIGLPIIVWAFVELGLMASEPGANRFGPAPLSAPAGG